MMLNPRRQVMPRRQAVECGRRSFTLAELMVVIAVIGILSALTVMSYRAMAKDAKMASGKNALMAVLDNARALSMQGVTVEGRLANGTPIRRNTNLVGVAFIVKYDPDKPGRQTTQMVLCGWTGRTDKITTPPPLLRLLDQFTPIPGQPTRELPPGIKVASPFYDLNEDESWMTQPELKEIALNNEYPGKAFMLLFHNGVVARGGNPMTATTGAQPSSSGPPPPYWEAVSWLDMNGDGVQNIGTPAGFVGFWNYDEPGDEPNMESVAFVAIYNDDEARESKSLNWNTLPNYEAQLTGPNGYISLHADRIHFNRYTGVAMK